MWGLTLTILTQPTSKEEATNGRDGVYQVGSRAYQQRHQRKPVPLWCLVIPLWCLRLSFLATGHLIAYDPLPHLRYLEAGLLLATPTSFWQHHIEPQSAFPQQLLQIIKIFSLRPPTFLSTKTNELTLTLSYQNIQLTSSYISFYKDQWANPNPNLYVSLNSLPTN